MLVDADVEPGKFLDIEDFERCGLLAALVATGGLPDLKHGHQPFGQVQRLTLAGGLGHLLDGRGPHQHVSLDAETAFGDMAGPSDATLPRMGSATALRIDDAELPVRAAGVLGDEFVQGLLRRHTAFQQFQAIDAEIGIDP